MRKYSLLIFLLFSSLVSSQEPLTFYVVDYPPYMIINTENEISGMDIDVVTAAFRESGQTVAFEVLPWKRVMKLMKVGEVAGTLSCSKREGREQYMLFSDFISTTRQAAISRKDTNVNRIKSLIDLSNYSVTTIDGWGTTNQLSAHHVDYTPSKDVRSALIRVLHRGVDVFYGPEIPTLHTAKKMNEEDNLKVTYIDDVASNELHLCLSRFYPQSENILSMFNHGLRIIKQNGKYQQLRGKYF
ncbi:transporter substrate-binding domain-containing protein [Vibrio sp. RC27]